MLAPAPPFALLLKRYRGRAGLTQEQLAERASLSCDAIKALERGTRQRPRPTTVHLLAQALSLTGAEHAHFEDVALAPTAVVFSAIDPTGRDLPPRPASW
jgi:transcriptional regulator with XRE-family HTH domain